MSTHRYVGRTAAAIGALALVTIMSAVPAQADPPAIGGPYLIGVGADLTHPVMDGLSKLVRQDRNNPSSPLILRSVHAGDLPPYPRAGCSFPLPRNSADGKNALRASEGQPSPQYAAFSILGCVDFARSTEGPSPLGTTGALSYASFGVDAVTYALNAGSDLPASMTIVQLQRIYRCLTTAIAGVPVQPRLPAASSDTRSYWNVKVGITESGISNDDYPCLTTLPAVPENEGNALNGEDLHVMPMSISQWISQENSGQVVNGVLVDVLDRRGESVLGRINGVASRTGPGGTSGPLNIAFPFSRDVYNVIPTADLGNPLIADVFLGATSQVCANRPVTEAFGFGFRASTGSQPANLAQQGCGDVYLKGDN